MFKRFLDWIYEPLECEGIDVNGLDRETRVSVYIELWGAYAHCM